MEILKISNSKFISKIFNILPPIVAAVIGALILPFSYHVIDSRRQSKISFNYGIEKNIGSRLLNSNYPHICSEKTLEKEYEDRVKEAYKLRNYTLEAVLDQDKIQIPMRLAKELLRKLHMPTMSLIDKSFVARFDVINNTQNAIVLHHLMIKTDDAYKEPLWTTESTFPNSFQITLTLSSSCRGYVITCGNKGIVVPAQSKFTVFIAFHQKPFIKALDSFIVIVRNGKQKTIKLREVVYSTLSNKKISLLNSIAMWFK